MAYTLLLFPAASESVYRLVGGTAVLFFSCQGSPTHILNGNCHSLTCNLRDSPGGGGIQKGGKPSSCVFDNTGGVGES